jgi:hypothetical protein
MSWVVVDNKRFKSLKEFMTDVLNLCVVSDCDFKSFQCVGKLGYLLLTFQTKAEVDHCLVECARQVASVS